MSPENRSHFFRNDGVGHSELARNRGEDGEPGREEPSWGRRRQSDRISAAPRDGVRTPACDPDAMRSVADDGLARSTHPGERRAAIDFLHSEILWNSGRGRAGREQKLGRDERRLSGSAPFTWGPTRGARTL